MLGGWARCASASAQGAEGVSELRSLREHMTRRRDVCDLTRDRHVTPRHKAALTRHRREGTREMPSAPRPARMSAMEL